MILCNASGIEYLIWDGAVVEMARFKANSENKPSKACFKPRPSLLFVWGMECRCLSKSIWLPSTIWFEIPWPWIQRDLPSFEGSKARATRIWILRPYHRKMKLCTSKWACGTQKMNDTYTQQATLISKSGPNSQTIGYLNMTGGDNHKAICILTTAPTANSLPTHHE